jgi:outer membrane lipoprotein SlyB
MSLMGCQALILTISLIKELGEEVMTKRFRATITAVTLSALLSITALPAFATQKKKSAAKKPAPKPAAKAPVAPATPYGKGYQSGYTAGYTQGDQDWHNNTPFDFRASRAYQERDRNDSQYASSGMYSQGYDLGFQMGYSDSYYGRSRNAEVPANGEIIARASGIPARDDRGDTRADNRDNYPNRDNPPSNRSNDRNNRNSDNRRSDSRSSASLNIPVNTPLRIKLTSQISTKTAHVNDRFTAIVVSPEEYANATVEGHISTVNRSGRVSGKNELSLVFDSITMENGRSGALTADLEKVFESENVKTVDEEGTIQSGSRSSDSKKRGGIGAAGGAIIGGIVGGVTGAIVGAVIGGAAGVGTVAIEGNKDLILEPGTEMQIRVSRNTRDR